jgi:hypothetical protein
MTVDVGRMPRTVVAAAALLFVAVAATAVADRLAPGRPRMLSVAGSVTAGGVWVCPVVSTGKPGGTLSLANGSVQPSAVRVRWVSGAARPLAFSLTLSPAHAVSIAAPASVQPVGAVVEWVGGDVVASRAAVMTVGRGNPALIGARCSKTGQQTLAVGGLRTFAADSHVWLLNPAGADAVADVSFLIDGDESRPESLRHRIVPARGRVDVRVGDFAFDQRAVTAIVRVSSGTVAADGTVATVSGAELIPGTPPAAAGFAVLDTPGGSALGLTAVGDEATTLTASTMSPAGQQTAAGLPDAFDAATPTTVVFREKGPFAVSLAAREGSPFAGVFTWGLAPRSDFAVLGPSVTSTRWLAVAGSPLPGRSLRMVLANPGLAPIRLSARLLTATGQIGAGNLAAITIPGGRVVSFPVGVASSPVGVEVVADGPVGLSLIIAAGSRAYRSAYAMLGAPDVPLVHPQLTIDPRAGVPTRDGGRR